jgi:UDP-N-acetylmuramate dehydrogenase
MGLREQFAEIVRLNEPLKGYTDLHIGGPAEMLVTPRKREELIQVVQACASEKVPLRVLGNGSKLLVRDEGVKGVVLRLSDPSFAEIRVEGNLVRVGSGAKLFDLIAETAKNGLAGFETLVGIAGTLGGCIRCNAGDRWGEMADFIQRVEVLDERGNRQVRERVDLHFSEHASDIDDPVILGVEFRLEKDSPENIEKRLRKAWIQRKAVFPYSFQSAIRAFKHPRGYSASLLIDRAGMSKAKVGPAEVSERNANWIIAQPGTKATDILHLVDQIQQRVRDVCGIQLEREMIVW